MLVYFILISMQTIRKNVTCLRNFVQPVQLCEYLTLCEQILGGHILVLKKNSLLTSGDEIVFLFFSNF